MASQIVILLIVLFLVLPILATANEKAVGHIRADINRRNLRVVETKRSAFRLRGHPAKFEVTYVTPESEVYKARCVVWANSEVFWAEPVRLGQAMPKENVRILPQNNGARETPAVSIRPEKEALIDGLTSGYKHERIWTAQQIGRLENVDELILYILQDISIDDPELEVREAALETIRSLA